MYRLRLFGVGLLAVVVFGSVLVSSAFAGLPTLLPETTTITTASSTSSKTKLLTLSGIPVECLKQSSESKTETEGKLGTFHIHFEECSATIAGLKVKCTSLGDATTGVILALGTFHLVYDKLGTGTALGVGILFLFPSGSEVHFECPAGGTLVLVKGAVLCLITPVAKKVKTTEVYVLLCEQKGGDQVESYWNAAGTATILPSLLTSLGTGTPESSGEEGEAKLASTVETEIMG